MPPRRLKKKRSKGPSALEWIIVVVVILIVGWAIWSFVQPSTSTTTSVSSAPDFTLPVIGPNGPTGQTIQLSSFRGRVVFLEFMEPWCPHCQHMAPIVENLYKEYGSQVVFISISANWQGATAQDVATFEQTYGSSWIFLYDSSGMVFQEYGVNSTPTFFIVGKTGSVYTTYQGEQTFDTLATDLTRASG